VLEELNDSGGTLAGHTTENGSYYGAWLHLQRATGESRFPLYDEIGSARGLVDASGVVTDTYEMDTFGRQVSASGATPNPYRFGGAWGYITDPSGMLQLGARFYWPEVGRFVSQDPARDEMNWYAYVENNPVVRADPRGRFLWWVVPAPPPQTREEACRRQLDNDLAACDTTYILELTIAFLSGMGDYIEHPNLPPNPTPPGYGWPSALDPYQEAEKRYGDCKKRACDRYSKCKQGKEEPPCAVIHLPFRPDLEA